MPDPGRQPAARPAGSGTRNGTGRTRCGASRVASSPRSVSASWTRPELELLQVAQAAVDQLAGPAGGAGGQVTRLDQGDLQAARGGVQGRTGAGHPAADDQHVEPLAAQSAQVGGPPDRGELAGGEPGDRGVTHPSTVTPAEPYAGAHGLSGRSRHRPAPPRWLGVLAAIVRRLLDWSGDGGHTEPGLPGRPGGARCRPSRCRAWRWPAVGVVGFVLVVRARPADRRVLATGPALRATGRAWFIAAALLAVLTCARAVPVAQHEIYLALLGGAGRWPARSSPAGPPARWPPPLAVAAGVLLLVPWLLAGRARRRAGDRCSPWSPRPRSGGSPRRCSAGVLGADGRLEPGPDDLGRRPAGRRRARSCSGAGSPGRARAAPAACCSACPMVGARRWPRRARRAAPAVGLAGRASALLGPLAFTDPEEVTLLLLGARRPVLGGDRRRGRRSSSGCCSRIGYGLLLARPGAALAAGAGRRAACSAAVGVYLGPGQPGLYGERLFVVLKQQADLSGLPAGTGQAAPSGARTEVYRRLVDDTPTRSQADLRRDAATGCTWRTRRTTWSTASRWTAAPAVRAWLSPPPRRRPGAASAQRLRPLPAPAAAAARRRAGARPARSGTSR